MNEAKELTKEQREVLQKYEKHLHTAFYADYVVGLPEKDVRVLFGVFNKINSSNETGYSCNFCKMRVLKALGRMYYKNDKVDNHKKEAKQ